MADPSTIAQPILILLSEHHWAQCQPHDSIRYVSGASVFMEITHHSESALENANTLAMQNSMAAYSTTAHPILILSHGRHWARHQLHTGIRYV